jgi:putative ABC transport system substrate-binding protein
MKNISRTIIASILSLGLAACGSTTETSSSASSAASSAAAGETYTVGIIQLVQHPALDEASQGFQDEIINELGEANVTFDYQNAAGDSATCTTIANQFVTEGVNLIMANATAALQAAAAATDTIPILGTSITEYGVALGLDNFDGTVGGNISGTSDLAPLEQQAAMFDELLPEAETIGILYCSAEPNSIYQAEVVQKALEDAGKTVNIYTFADTNDVASVTQQACSECDALYIPTDNTAASCTEAIDNVASGAGIPIIAGEAGIMSGCGIASLSIDYYELGVTTGKMAVKILTGESDISTMPIEYYENPQKIYDADRCASLGITVPDDYTAYTAEE